MGLISSLTKTITNPRKLTILTALMLVVVSGYGVVRATKVEALSGSAFSAGRIIDDSVFFNGNSMSNTDIQNFLNSKVPVCDTNHAAKDGNNPPFTCLKDYRQDTPTRASEAGLCNGFSGGNKSSAEIIGEVARSCSVSPKALLVLLQKEQSLVTDTWPWDAQYRAATGFGCPDTAACDSTYYGFFNQVYSAARQFKRYSQNSNSYNYKARRNNYIQYNPNSSCGGSTIYIENQATAGLYNYTPYQPNSAALNNLYGTGDSCSAYGNRNFWRLFNDWFGGTWSDEQDWLFVTSSVTTANYNPGGEGSGTIVIKNIGYKAWYSDNNLPSGQQPTRLATLGYENSPFADPGDASWLGTRNQVKMTPDVVQPGENATFTFKILAPYRTITYGTRFVPIVGGAFLRDLGVNVQLTSHTPDWTPVSSAIDTWNLLPNQQAPAVFKVKNTSGSKWYSDNNLPANRQPTRLATVGYEDSPFADTADPNWLGTRGQIKMTPDVVAPGETATFSAFFIGPIGNGSNKPFKFHVVVGGVPTVDKGLVFNFVTPKAVFTYDGVSATKPPTTMSPGQTASVSYTIKNTGNIVWHDEAYMGGAHSLRLITFKPYYRSSPFYNSADSNWLSIAQVKKPLDTIWPSMNNTFTYSWRAPSTPGFYQESFGLSIGGIFYPDLGTHFDTNVQ